MPRFLDSPAKRASFIVFVVAVAVVLIDFMVYVAGSRYIFADSASRYLDCWAGSRWCPDYHGYMRTAGVVALVAAIGLFWDRTYGRLISIGIRILDWIRTGK